MKTKTKVTTVSVDEGALERKASALAKDAYDKAGAAKEDNSAPITKDEDYLEECAELIEVKVAQKNLEAEIEAATVDTKALLARIAGAFAEPKTRLAEAEEIRKDAVRAYAVALDAKAHGLRRAAAKLSPSAEARRQELLSQADEITLPRVPGISYRARLKIEVLDFARVPQEYKRLVVDEEAIELAVSRGADIPGVRVTDARTVTVTPKNAVK